MSGCTAAGWFAAIATAALDKAVAHAKENDPDVIEIEVPVLTLDNQPLTDTVLIALRTSVDERLTARNLDMQTAAIEQRVLHGDDPMRCVVVSIYT